MGSSGRDIGVIRWHSRVAGFAAEPDAVEIATTRIGENLVVDDPENAVAQALDATRSPVAEHELLARIGTPTTPARELVEALVEERILIRDGGSEPGSFGRLIEAVAPAGVTGREAARQLEASQVLVLGAGGVGSWVVDGLARSGVGSIVIVDPDEVSESNLRRSAFAGRDVGRRKVDVAAERVRDLRPATRVTTIATMLESPEDVAALAVGSHLVIVCADEPDPHVVGVTVARALVPQGIPHLFAGYLGAAVRIGPVWTPLLKSLPCYRCGLLAGLPGGPPRATTAFGAPQAMIAAALAVQHALVELVGSASDLRGRVAVIDPVALRSWTSRLRRHRSCEVCATSYPVTSMLERG